MNIKGKEYKINRETSVVSEWDKIYCNLLKKILKEGELFENRTGIDTLSIEGVAFKLDAGSEFPILESKKVAIKNALSEMLWSISLISSFIRFSYPDMPCISLSFLISSFKFTPQFSSFTNFLKRFPLSSKLLNISKLVDAGDNKTTSPSFAMPLAVFTTSS